MICPLLFCGDFILRIAAIAGLTCALALGVAAQTATEKKPKTTSKASAAAKSGASHPKSGSKASSAHPATSVHPKAAAGAHSKASGKHGKTTAKRSKKGSSKAAAWRSRQLAPTPDRYKDIQSALVTRGYLKQAPNGVWDTPSADALRHFQQDQNLEPSGKLNSLSLIALGLGAKRGSPVVPSTAKPAPAALTPQAPRLQNPEQLPPPTATPPNAAPNPAEPGVPDTTRPSQAQPSPAPTTPAPTNPPPPDAQPRG